MADSARTLVAQHATGADGREVVHMRDVVQLLDAPSQHAGSPLGRAAPRPYVPGEERMGSVEVSKPHAPSAPSGVLSWFPWLRDAWAGVRTVTTGRHLCPVPTHLTPPRLT